MFSHQERSLKTSLIRLIVEFTALLATSTINRINKQKNSMETKKIIIQNSQGENLDVVISGDQKKPALVLVHDLGLNKNKEINLFVGVNDALKYYFTIIRFDFSGYGLSEGKQEDSCLSKMTDDLRAVVEYAKNGYQRVSVIAHGLGTLVVSNLLSREIERVAFTSPPENKAALLIKNLQERIQKNGGEVNENGVSIYPRTSGEVQRIGPKFWQDLRDFDPVRQTKKLSLHSSLAIFEAQDDEITSEQDWKDLYRGLGIICSSLPGDHNFTDGKDRKKLIADIKTFLDNSKRVIITYPANKEEDFVRVKRIIKENSRLRELMPFSHFDLLHFPFFYWRQCLTADNAKEKIEERLIKEFGENEELWHYGQSLAEETKFLIELSKKAGIQNIGKTPEMLVLLTEYLGI